MSSGERSRVTVSMPTRKKDQLVGEAEERSMSTSSYARQLIEAGQKQVAVLESSIETKEDSIEKRVIETLSQNKSEAISQDEISGIVLDELEQQIYEVLDETERVSHSAANGGYYLE